MANSPAKSIDIVIANAGLGAMGDALVMPEGPGEWASAFSWESSAREFEEIGREPLSWQFQTLLNKT